MRILVAEDEAKARPYLAQGLGEQVFSVELVEDGNSALSLLREHVFDVAVLDVMLPGRDGWSICSTASTCWTRPGSAAPGKLPGRVCRSSGRSSNCIAARCASKACAVRAPR